MRRGRTPAAWRPYSEQEALALSPAGVAAAVAAVCADTDEGDPHEVPAAGPCLTSALPIATILQSRYAISSAFISKK